MRWNVCRKALLFVMEATMSDLTILLVWFSFLLALLAIVFFARIGAVKTAVEGLINALRNFPPHK